MNVTITDIARVTGLSTATISKYLNNKSIREENRILIENAIRELGYVPNRNAQLLRSKNTRTIGIVLSDLGNYFWGSVINSIIRYFAAHDYTVIICSFFFDHDNEINTIQDIISQHLDGVIMLPNNVQDDLYHLLQDAGIPVVILDQLPVSSDRYPVDCVISDNYKGGAQLAVHLLENGHTNIRLLESYTNSYTIDQRIQGFLDVYKQNGYDLSQQLLDAPPVRFYDTDITIAASKKHFSEIMESPDPPTAIFFVCYISAMGGLSAAGSMQLSVPEDVSLVCFDDDPLFKTMSAAMTCVSQDRPSIGTHASRLLLRRIRGDYTDFPKVDMLDVNFHPRRSVKNLNRP